MAELDKKIKSFNVGQNPYTWFTMEALEDTWKNLQKIIKERDRELAKEAVRQEENDKVLLIFFSHFIQVQWGSKLWMLKYQTHLKTEQDSLASKIQTQCLEFGHY